ncbi:uncharacterized protein LOC129599918 isoform X1 [Paramacrobiotus metropolitanus]|uniref:uncharacterized protein LOC129599918 isoform X1 n=1 Tax=Paramacrobiotus metropolitanus TaxID=2943436 RepID=UPI002445AA25|nr:uncharacterized protein LOC129599918 isoform X1 [Paramacrobiotus metropolitanus]XP_055354252.1 uncharacterized protein LOC129599918 isoform X1 [Paramacrobiotus metropolitanus]
MESHSIKTSWLVASFLCFQGIFSILPTPNSASADVPPFNFSIYPQCNFSTNTTPSTQTPVPKLAETFTIKVEGKIGENAYFDSDGYYEKEGQRGATYILSQGTKTSYLYDFITGDAFSVVGENDEYSGRQCTKEDLWKTGCNTYAYFIAELAGYSVTSGKCNISPGNVTDQGVQNTTVRAIKVQMWEQCVHDNNLNTTWRNRYYYTAPGVTPPSPSKNATPIRFESLQLDGKDVGKIQVYDFTYYYPEVKDKSVFLPDPGVYCPGWRRENQSVSILPDQFSLTMLTLAKKDRDVHSLKMNFDSQHFLVSYITDSLSGTHFPPSFVKNRTLYRTVHDYNSGLSFTMPVGTWLLGGAGCNVTAIDSGSLDATKSDSSGVVHLKSARDLFGLNRSSALYVGQRDFNGMPTYVWVSQRSSNDSKRNITTTTETYWLHENWTSSAERVLVGVVIYRTFPNGTILETFQSTVSDFNAFPFYWKTFDVVDCLRNGKQQMITFCMKVQNYTDVKMRMPAFETAIRDALSNLTATSPLQFTDIQVMKGDEENEPHIWVTVLDWVNITVSGTNVTKYQNASEVVDALRKLFDNKDLPFVMKFANRTQSVTFLKGSIQSGRDLVKPTAAPISPATPATTLHPTDTPTAAPVVQDGYTSGSMAGLGIAMIIIGGVAGLVAGFLMWKRNTGIAYQVYD